MPVDDVRLAALMVVLDPAAVDEYRTGLDAVRSQFDVPSGFPAAVIDEARRAATRPFGPGHSAHVDRTDVDFVTIDPAHSTDLDQAFALERSGADIVLRYAIADVGWFVQSGGPIDTEAWARGVTVYLPDGRAGLHPPELAEGAASLLPDGARPAVVFIVRVADDGAATLDGVERAVIHSRAKLAYEHVGDADLPPEFAELAARVEAAELARGAQRIDFPEQEVARSGNGFALRFRPRRPVERRASALSLATNLAVAAALSEARTGLFRTMPPVDERGERRLRHTAAAFGLTWARDETLAQFERALDAADPRAAAFQLAVRRASGAASYEPFRDGVVPWHAAVAATYCHATAPLRRLADRFVVEAALAVANGNPPPPDVSDAFGRLPGVMDGANARASQVDRAAIDLAEAIVLATEVGEVFDAVVTDEDDRGVRIQLTEPAIVARTTARGVDPGDEIRVRVDRVDTASRTVELSRVG